MINKLMGWLDNKDLGLLIIRLVLAGVFFYASWMKFANMDQTIAGFGQVGLAPFLAYLVATVEMLSAIGMLLGAYARHAGILLAIVMVFAIALVTGNLQDIIHFELDLVILGSALGIAMIGPGRYSIKE